MRVALTILFACASCSLATSLDDLGSRDAESDAGADADAVASVSLTSVAMNPASVIGGMSSTGTVVLSAPAPPSGANVTVSSKSTVVGVPSVVMVAAGQTVATFTATTTAVSASTTVEIDAVFGASKSASLTVTPMPTQTIFTTQVPALNVNNGNVYELGTRFSSAKDGKIIALRFWKAVGESGTHVARLWSDSGTLLGAVTFTSETSSGWQEQALSPTIAITASVAYRVSYNNNVAYAKTDSGLTVPIVNGDLTGIASCSGGVGLFPSVANASNFFADVRFQ